MQTKEEIESLHRRGMCERIHPVCLYRLGQFVRWKGFTDILGEYHPEEVGIVTDIRRMCGRYRLTAEVIRSQRHTREVEADMDCFERFRKAV